MNVIDKDPTGIAAAVILFTGVLFTAIDPGGALAGRWGTVVQTGVALVVLVAARARAYKPGTVDKIIASNTGRGAD